MHTVESIKSIIATKSVKVAEKALQAIREGDFQKAKRYTRVYDNLLNFCVCTIFISHMQELIQNRRNTHESV